MIVLKNVMKIYGTGDSEVKALDKVSLTMEQGEMLAVMGTSGSGKTTLLNVISGMDTFQSGEYYFEDIPVHALKGQKLHKFRREHIGFVFQNFALLNQYTVYENVELPLCIQNVSQRVRRRKVMQVLEWMGIEELTKKRPSKLSGGQQQRCAIARALVSGNELILADEPTGALDKRNGMELLDILTGLNKEGKTILIVTHDNQVAQRAGRIVYMEDGRLKLHEEAYSEK